MLQLPTPVTPMWALMPTTVFLIVLSIEVGYRFGRRQRNRPQHDPDTIASGLATPTVGLLGLMLAFTFGWSATRFDARRVIRVQEAEATSRLYRLADFLPPEDRQRVRQLLLEYIEISLQAKTVASFEASFARREALHAELWDIAIRAGNSNLTSSITAQYVGATNNVLEAHLTRSILATSSRIPQAIHDGLLVILMLTMAMIGYQLGLAGSPRSPMLIPLTAALTMVLFLIADLDRPMEGWLRVGDQALEEVRRDLEIMR